MRLRLPVMLLATLTLAVCGGRPANPVAAEPVEPPVLAATGTVPPANHPAPPATRPAPPADRPDPAASAEPAAPTGVHHILERGQTLYTLARLYEVPLSTLMSANGITDPT